MEKIILKAEKRNLFGRKAKVLRKKGILPANFYGKDIKSTALQVSLKDFLSVWEKVGETGVVYLEIEGQKESYPVLFHNLQKNVVTGELLHVDFRKVNLKEKVQVSIPIEVKGEAPAVSKGGVLVQLINEIEVEALPTDLVDKIEVDVSGLEEIGQGIMVKDLKIDRSKIKILGVKEEQLLVQIEAPSKEEVSVAETPTEEIKEEKPEQEKPNEEKEATEEK